MFRKKNSTIPKIISSDKATELLDKSWCKADLHVHTCCSYDVPASDSTNPENVMIKGISEGMDFVTFTDHDTVRAYDVMGWNREGLTTGLEMSIKDTENIGHTIHVNIFEFDKGQYSEIETLMQREQNIYVLLDYLKSNDILHMYNHPFWFTPGEKPNIFAVTELAKHFPVVEYNMQDLKQKNFFSMILAQRYKKGIAVTTDSHTGRIGRVHTIAKGDTFREYFRNIEKGRSHMVINEPIWKHITHELDAWIELVFNMEKGTSEEMTYSTGIKAFDKVVDLVGKEKLGKHPKFNNITMNLIQQVSNSGIPVFLYMISKQPQVSRISRIVNS